MVHICAFPTCPVSRTKKYNGISLFQLPKRKAEFYSTWRKQLLDILSKYRVMDATFKKEIMDCKITLHICERHFTKEDMEFTPTGIKTLRLQALPTINLPARTLETPKPEERRPIHRTAVPEIDIDFNVVSQYRYQSFAELCKRVERCKLDDWTISMSISNIKFISYLHPHIVPQFEITIDDSLEFSVVVFGWLLSDVHPLYKKYKRSVRNVTVSNLLTEIKQYHLCVGLCTESINHIHSNIISHVIPCHIDLQNEEETKPFVTKQFTRYKDCLLLNDNPDEACIKCDSYKKNCSNQRINIKPVHPNAPLSKTSCKRLIETVKMQRIENQELKKKLQKEINEKSINVDNELAGDFEKIMAENSNNITPFMRLFWEQQKKSAITKGTSNRYHPMIIRFCLSLASKSASAYDELRSSNVLTLPSRRTLRDYKNAIKPHAGFNPAVIDELIKTTKTLKDCQRNIVLSFDEMKIQENLVYDKYSGNLVGYVDLGDPDINYSSFDNADELASHVMVFYIRGLASDLKFELGYFGTRGMLSYQIMSRFWRAVSILEDTCDLHVIAAVSDGAPSNRSFFKMHKQMSRIDSEVVYRTENIFHPGRYIWFFADAPHLMKTARNCIYHSGNGKHSRLLWNDGKEIVWKHFIKIVDDQLSLKFMVKLTEEHIRLNPYSAMNVRLATQTLSESVGKILYQRYPEAHATAELCIKMDKFFDILNVRNETEGVRKRKIFLNPFRSIDDERFSWLENEFLCFLENWKTSIDNRTGNFGRVERNKMFLSHQTYEGLRITVNSVIESTKFLLSEGGMKYVLTERFNQDVAEENFGRHRGIGRRNENPTLHMFGYDSNTLRMARSVVPMRGNTKGAHTQKRRVSWSNVDHTPLPKRR